MQAGKDMGGRDCIAIQFLYCNLVGAEIVLQYTAVYCDRQWSKGEAVSLHGRARAQ